MKKHQVEIELKIDGELANARLFQGLTGEDVKAIQHQFNEITL